MLYLGRATNEKTNTMNTVEKIRHLSIEERANNALFAMADLEPSWDYTTDGKVDLQMKDGMSIQKATPLEAIEEAMRIYALPRPAALWEPVSCWHLDVIGGGVIAGVYGAKLHHVAIKQPKGRIVTVYTHERPATGQVIAS